MGESRVRTTSPIRPREASRARAERKGPKSVSRAEARSSVLRLRPQRSRRACTLDDGRAYAALCKPRSARPLGDQERCGGVGGSDGGMQKTLAVRAVRSGS